MEEESLVVLSHAISSIANAITVSDSSPGFDSGGTHVSSLTEAVMGMTEALTQIASAIQDVVTAIESQE